MLVTMTKKSGLRVKIECTPTEKILVTPVGLKFEMAKSGHV